MPPLFTIVDVDEAVIGTEEFRAAEEAYARLISQAVDAESTEPLAGCRNHQGKFSSFL